MKLLHYKSDTRSVAFVLAALGVYAVQWSGLFRHPALYAASLALAFIACVINHNHQHHATFVPRWMNRAFSALLSLAMGLPATVIVAMHHQNHHVFNNRPQDHVRATIVGFRWRLLNLLVFPFVAVAHFAAAKVRAVRAWRTKRPHLYRQLWRERVILYGVVLSALALRPLETVLYLAVPYAFGQWCLLAINHFQHVGCDSESTYHHSRDVIGRWSNWWFFNNGFHTAHHLRPGMHWSRLPRYHAELREQLRPDLQYRSFAWAIVDQYLIPRRRKLVAKTELPAVDRPTELELSA